MTAEPSWIARGRAHIGLREVPGKGDNPIIQRWLRGLRAWWSDDATPWCGTFCAAMLQPDGFRLPQHWYRARAWLNWGEVVQQPVYGAIVVFERQGGGHVGFVVGVDERNRLMVLGGNQGDAVSVAPFDRSRVLGYRYPYGTPIPTAPAPLLASRGAMASSNEA